MRLRKGLLIGLIIFGSFMLLSILFIMGIRAALESKPLITSNSVLTVTLSGPVTEWFSRDAFSRELAGANVQLHDIRKALEMAAVDRRIKGVYLRISFPQMGWAKADAIRRAISAFRESGKFVIAYLDYCDELAYYVALAAERIYLPPHGFTGLNGFAAEVPFIKGTFNKLGIEPQVENIGKYKSAGDVLKRETMSPAHREATKAMLQDVYDRFVSTVCEVKQIEKTEFEALLDSGVYVTDALTESPLIDGLKYEADVVSEIKERVHGPGSNAKINMVGVASYARLSPEEVGIRGQNDIALIYAVGTILSGYSGQDLVNGRTMGSETIAQILRMAAEDDKIKAVILRVDSPGGSAQAADQIWAEIRRVRARKPVVVSMSDVAASGGYWIAMDTDCIVTEALTATGSIGVVSSLFDLSGAYKKLGINWETVQIGRHADVPTDKRPLSPEERERFKQLNRDFYQVFVHKVAAARGKSWDEIDEVAQGRVWTGQRALQYGLVDTLGGLEVALQVAKEKAGLPQDASTRWLVYPEPKGFLQSLFEKLNVRIFSSLPDASGVAGYFDKLPTEARTVFRQLAMSALFRDEKILAISPFIPEIR